MIIIPTKVIVDAILIWIIQSLLGNVLAPLTSTAILADPTKLMKEKIVKIKKQIIKMKQDGRTGWVETLEVSKRSSCEGVGKML